MCTDDQAHEELRHPWPQVRSSGTESATWSSDPAISAASRSPVVTGWMVSSCHDKTSVGSASLAIFAGSGRSFVAPPRRTEGSRASVQHRRGG